MDVSKMEIYTSTVHIEEGKVITVNRSARHEYFVLETFEAGIELFGTEVKSLRAGTVNLKDSYVQVKDGEIYLIGVHISPYDHGNRFNLDPERTRKLLMHKREIIRLYSTVKQDGLTLVPTKCYFKDSKVKFEIGLARGKKDYDKRAVMAKKEAARDIDRAMKNAKKYHD